MNNKGISLLTKALFKICAKSYKEHTFVEKEVECFVTKYKGCQVVAFRGTEASKFFSGGGWRDVIRDIRSIPWKDKRVGWSHAGFLKGARAVVDKHLVKSLDRNIPIYVTGHSLGGALAINASALLHAEGFIIKKVVTFGSPRTFTKDTVKLFRKTYIEVDQYSNLGDPIPDVPFRFFGYRHINEIHTKRRRKGYSILRNHMIPHYKEALYVQVRKKVKKESS